MDRASHCGVRPDSTFGRGMFVPFDWRLELAETGELRADLKEVSDLASPYLRMGLEELGSVMVR